MLIKDRQCIEVGGSKMNCTTCLWEYSCDWSEEDCEYIEDEAEEDERDNV